MRDAKVCFCAVCWPLRPGSGHLPMTIPRIRSALIVPFAAGGAADSVARIVGKRVGETLGQTVVVEDRGGGGGIIGTEIVRNSDPDGYTLLLGQSGPISINPGIYPKLSYDPEKDFVPISMTTAYPYVLVVNPSLGVKTVAELVALAKSKPGQLNYGTAGVGASNHLCTELFDNKAGIKMTHIPYRGTSLAVADLIAGQVQVVFADPGLRAVAGPGRHADSACGHQQGALAGRARSADDCRKRLSRLRCRRLARHHGAGRHAAGDHRPAAMRRS